MTSSPAGRAMGATVRERGLAGGGFKGVGPACGGRAAVGGKAGLGVWAGSEAAASNTAAKANTDKQERGWFDMRCGGGNDLEG